MTIHKHRVYVGGFSPSDDILFIKVGMTSNLNCRIDAYAGMIPGGLSFAYSVETESRGEAFCGEKSVMCMLASNAGFKAVGGEWFQCHPFMKGVAIDALLAVGKGFVQARITAPQPFGVKQGDRRGKRRAA